MADLGSCAPLLHVELQSCLRKRSLAQLQPLAANPLTEPLSVGQFSHSLESVLHAVVSEQLRGKADIEKSLHHHVKQYQEGSSA